MAGKVKGAPGHIQGRGGQRGGRRHPHKLEEEFRGRRKGLGAFWIDRDPHYLHHPVVQRKGGKEVSAEKAGFSHQDGFERRFKFGLHEPLPH